MTDAELRALVREAVARHRGGHGAAPSSARASAIGATAPALLSHVVPQPGPHLATHGTPQVAHASQSMYLTLVNVGDACLIEPDVPCNHCGYCRAHGH